VTWNKSTISLESSGKKVSIIIGKTTGTTNGTTIDLDTAPETFANATYVPLSLLIEELGVYTSWKETNKSVNILKK
jgi:hypothetical protein